MYISDKLSTAICNTLLQQRMITDNEFPYYQYSLDFVLDLFIFNGSLIALSTIFNCSILGIIYVLTLTPLKMLSGGAHAWNRISCSIISYAIFIISLLTIKNNLIRFRSITAILLFFFCVSVITIISPVDCKTKRIPPDKRGYYKKRCGILSLLLALLFIFFVKQNFVPYFSMMTICVIITVTNQILGLFINLLNRKVKRNAKS